MYETFNRGYGLNRGLEAPAALLTFARMVLLKKASKSNRLCVAWQQLRMTMIRNSLASSRRHDCAVRISMRELRAGCYDSFEEYFEQIRIVYVDLVKKGVYGECFRKSRLP